jgi:hypothetical protein
LGVVKPPSKTWVRRHEDRLEKLCGTRNQANKRGRLGLRFPSIIGIVVPASVKKRLSTMLEVNFGFNRSTVYPDFASIAQAYETSSSWHLSLPLLRRRRA